MGDVVAQQLEALMVKEVLNVVPRSSEEIVHAQHLAAKLQQSLGEMRAKKSCSAGNENSSFEMLHCCPVVGRAVVGAAAHSNGGLWKCL